MRAAGMWTGLARVSVVGALLASAACSSAPSEDRASAELESITTTGSRADGAAMEPAPPPPPPVEAPPPPPPPPAAPGEDSSGVEEVTVTGSRVRRSAAASASPTIAVTDEGGRRQQAQSGTLTAADHDDLLNPELYRDYVRRHLRTSGDQQAPRLDVAGRVVARVLDRSGRPVPFATVTARAPGGDPVRLATAANGEAVFFPAMDGLGQSFTLQSFTLAPRAGQGSAPRTVDVRALGPDRMVTLRTDQAAIAPRALDLALVIDTTGSMDDELAYLQTELTAILASLQRTAPGVDTRVAVVVYRDVGDDYVVRRSTFTGDVRAARTFLEAQEAQGGGDYPEAVEQALGSALNLDWRPGAVKVLMHVADAPPHPENAAAAWDMARRARAQRIHIVPVAASGVAAEAEYLMRGSAALTQSRYLFLTNDSGVGRPKADPDVDCYVVTRLDGLIRRVLTQLVTGRRVEPAPPEVIRVVGDYDAGVCRSR